MKAIVFLLLIAIANSSYAQDAEKNIIDKKITIPPPNKPMANYVTSVRVGNMLYLSGHGACGTYTPVDTGKLGKTLTVEQGYEAARHVGLCMIATLKANLGDLNKIKRIVRVMGMVNSTDTFRDHPKVMNGFSDLMVEVFGENGKHVRAAVGMNSLPNNISVEVEMWVELN